MWQNTCPHCGHKWRSKLGPLGGTRCPYCGRDKHPDVATPEDVEAAKAEAEAERHAPRRWALPFGGWWSRIAFVLVVLAFFGAVAWVVVPPIIRFWTEYTQGIEEQAAPP